MSPSPSLRVVVVAGCLLGLIAVPGCGGTTRKKPVATIAERLARARKDKSPGGTARELARIARQQLESGDKTGAGKTITEARKAVPDDGDAVIFAPRLVEIAAVQADLGDRKQARATIDAAVTAIGGVSDAALKAGLLAKAGVVYGAKSGGIGDAGAAKKVLDQAKDAAGEVPERFRPQTLAAVALGYSDAGLAGDAGEMVQALEETAGAIEDPRAKAEALATVATVRAKGGDKGDAAKLLADAAKVAKSIDAAANKTFALVAVAKAMRSTGDRKGAAGLLAEAEKAAGKIADPEQQKEALGEVRRLQAATKG